MAPYDIKPSQIKSSENICGKFSPASFHSPKKHSVVWCLFLAFGVNDRSSNRQLHLRYTSVVLKCPLVVESFIHDGFVPICQFHSAVDNLTKQPGSFCLQIVRWDIFLWWRSKSSHLRRTCFGWCRGKQGSPLCVPLSSETESWKKCFFLKDYLKTFADASWKLLHDK